MNRQLILKLLPALFFLYSVESPAQYILNGSAQKVSCNCYTLTTTSSLFQSGSVWNSHKISLDQSFDFWFNVYLGCLDANGADGIVFMLQPNSTSVGAAGEGMGFDGVVPSIGITLDTWQNFNWNDPPYDHISIQANGNVNHNSDLAGPVPVSATSNNVEDCQWHRLRITWDAGAHWLRAYFDGVLRVEKQIDLVKDIFFAKPEVYWGFSAATGGSVNLQQFCTALDPIVKTDLVNNNGCEGKPVEFNNASVSFAPITSYNWSFGDGTTSTAENPPPHLYATPGSYPVHLKVKGQDGCENDSTFSVTINANPKAAFQVFDTCADQAPRVQLQSNNTGVSYQWILDGGAVSNQPEPVLSPPVAGTHQLQLVVTSNYACGAPATAAASFVMKPRPAIAAEVEDGCTGLPLSFTGRQTDNTTTISRWTWEFGDGAGDNTPVTSHTYNQPNVYDVKLWAAASNGCASDTLSEAVQVNHAQAVAGADTAVITGLPFQLHGSGNGSFLWEPPFGLSDPTIADPVVTLNSDQQFILTVTTAEGCVARDTILVKTFTGPAVYVPSAFTPNGDGRNDRLKPVYVGIQELKQFAVFNRWGQEVFHTTDLQKGWDGAKAIPGTYVWFIKVINNLGQPMLLKGTVTVIR